MNFIDVKSKKATLQQMTRNPTSQWWTRSLARETDHPSSSVVQNLSLKQRSTGRGGTASTKANGAEKRKKRHYNSTASAESNGRAAPGVRCYGTIGSIAIVSIVRPSGACRAWNPIGWQCAIADVERRVRQHPPHHRRLHLAILILPAQQQQLGDHGGGRRRVHCTYSLTTQHKNTNYHNQAPQQTQLQLSRQTHFQNQIKKEKKTTEAMTEQKQ